MKQHRAIIFPLTLGLVLLSFSGNAQVVNCSEKYESALGIYNYGLADSALNILKPCLESKQALKQVSRETAANMYRLAALSSIMTGNPGDAERYVRELLKYQPDYAENIRDDDLEEFRLMLNRSTSQPSLRVGIRVGMNIPLLSLEKNYTDPEKSAATYTLDGNTGFQLGLTVEKTLTRSLALEAGAGITQALFNYQVRSSQTGPYQYDQTITYLEVPVLARYYFAPNSAIKPYVQGGISGKFSLYKREKSDDFGSYWLTESADSDYILSTFLTDLENIGLVAGAGASYNLKKFSIRVDIRYTHHLTSSGKISNFDNISGYDDIPADEAFSYTNDINLITLKDLQISLGFVYNLKYKVF